MDKSWMHIKEEQMTKWIKENPFFFFFKITIKWDFCSWENKFNGLNESNADIVTWKYKVIIPLLHPTESENLENVHWQCIT